MHPLCFSLCAIFKQWLRHQTIGVVQNLPNKCNNDGTVQYRNVNGALYAVLSGQRT